MSCKCVFIIAGEASGDNHGAKLVNAMRAMNKGLFFCGIGGDSMEKAGVRIVFDASKLSVVGITEVFSKIPNIIRGMTLVKKLLKSLRPDLLILIDFPDFNLHIASTAKKNNIPVLYYISPQIWAWRQGRVKKIAKRVDHMAVILPFEAEYYRGHSIPVTFVGHPLLDQDSTQLETMLSKEGEGATVLGILPGSRNSEIKRNLSVMLEAAKMLSDQIENIRVIVSVAQSVYKIYVEQLVKQYQNHMNLEIDTRNIGSILERCDFVIAVSGTVTLEAAIYGVPMVIVYKVSMLSYLLGRWLIKVNSIGLANLIAGKKIVPELVQKDATPDKIADMAFNMLSNPERIENIRKDLIDIKQLMGGHGASKRVAGIAMKMLDNEN
jgi:lipid-A-disaccharide synthase